MKYLLVTLCLFVGACDMRPPYQIEHVYAECERQQKETILVEDETYTFRAQCGHGKEKQ